MKALGQHLILEFHGCDRAALSSVRRVRAAMLSAAKESGASVIDSVFHRFEPHGVSGVVVIAQSHFAVHTWPEHRYASADLFTCGESIDPWKAIRRLKKLFRAAGFSAANLQRGVLPGQGG